MTDKSGVAGDRGIQPTDESSLEEVLKGEFRRIFIFRVLLMMMPIINTTRKMRLTQYAVK